MDNKVLESTLNKLAEKLERELAKSVANGGNMLTSWDPWDPKLVCTWCKHARADHAGAGGGRCNTLVGGYFTDRPNRCDCPGYNMENEADEFNEWQELGDLLDSLEGADD